MMLKVDGSFGDRSITIGKGSASLDQAPEVARIILAIDGVRSVFLARDFITVTRQGGADWKPILAEASRLLAKPGEAQGDADPEAAQAAPATLAPVEIAVLEFRNLPSQVRVNSSEEQLRVALPQRFNDALIQVLGAIQANYLAERRWRALDPRYGEPSDVAQMVADELDSALSTDELARLAHAAIAGRAPGAAAQSLPTQAALITALSDSDWRQRLAAIQVIKVDEDSFPVLLTALSDPKSAVRRWAAAALGSSDRAAAVAPLCAAVAGDPSVIVRRTAGDALSDLGTPGAIATMRDALSDRSHLVRWRAARYLNEQGDHTVVAALERASEAEPDFGVCMEMNAALERIRGGGASLVPMWLRLSRGAAPSED
jgi:HEAT repeat protein